MDKNLSDVLRGTPDNYILPFYWQLGNHRDKLREQIAEIASCGVGALCVESRPHKEFAKDDWWADMDIILDECEKRGMKVWILDDDHFPTGHANGMIKEKYPERRRWAMVEEHLDVVGPMSDASILLRRKEDADNILIGAYMYAREEFEETLSGEPVDVSSGIRGDYLYLDIPEGVHRVFTIWKSRSGIGNAEYVDMLSDESTDVMIEAVYEPHYQRYAKYFGNTLAGFFSDEPNFGNVFSGDHTNDFGFYIKTVGLPALALPWHEDVLKMMEKELGYNPKPYLASLWFPMENFAPKVRLAYMNAVTKLWRERFSFKLGNWCRAHGVLYIGHIIEDQNSHARLGHSGGHYFRSLEGQDMGGVDIVLHQVIPGMESVDHTASSAGNECNGIFYNYVLAKLAASLGELDPQMKGRAMCEVFGAYGWAESVSVMKWLTDFLLVRGVNHFVPHAFSPVYPNPDCPPHFGAEGHDPQFDGFRHLMRALNKETHLLFGGTHIADAAILYHAEAEWMNCDFINHRNRYMLTEAPAKVLYDDQLDFDIVPIDYLEKATVENERMVINGVSFGCLIVPYAALLPDAFYTQARRLADEGLRVWFVDKKPDDCPKDLICDVVPLDRLNSEMRAEGLYDISLTGDHELLRVFHTKRGKTDVFMFFNESVAKRTDTVVSTGISGKYASLDLLGDNSFAGESGNGDIRIVLEPGESRIVVFDPELESELQSETKWHEIKTLDGEYGISLAESDNLDDFRSYKRTSKLKNITAPDEMPDFSGKMKYETTFSVTGSRRLRLDLGRVGETARVYVNGKLVGDRVTAPYSYDITDYVREGENELVVIVSNTLANRVKDHFSTYMQIPPSGLLGPVKLLTAE